MAESRIDKDLLVHCRFADTRVLPSLLDALSQAQLARLSLDIGRWCWINHLGEVKCWQHNVTASGNQLIDSAPHLELDAQQFSAMLDASEPDTMFSLLLDNTPELVPQNTLGDFRTRLSQILATANTLRLTSPNDRWQFTVLSLSCKEEFHHHPDLQTTWKAMELHGTKLEDEMKHWSDELWAEIQANHTESLT